MLISLPFLLVLASCSTPPPQPEPQITSETTQEPAVPTPTETISPPSPRYLSICLGYEPETLFLYGGVSPAAQSVLAAVYDGPIDVRGYELHPVILSELPSLANDGVTLERVQVSQGVQIVDSEGNLVTLTEGVAYYPAGCRNRDCAMLYAGEDSIAMDQLRVRFNLLPDLQWSDGQPLTSADSVYSYELASQLPLGRQPDLVQFTATYQSIDESSVIWRGVPGYITPHPDLNFFAPLPSHLWSGFSLQELQSAQISARTPVGWGPYVIQEWVPGDHITLIKNERYARVAEGLPNFDYLVYRFVQPGEQALTALRVGECDLLDETTFTEMGHDDLVLLEQDEEMMLVYRENIAWEHLLFGIAPLDASKTSVLQNSQVRKSIAMCIDRQKIVDEFYGEHARVMDSYIPENHPLFAIEATTYAYDPGEAASILESAGWVDHDQDHGTPRQAYGVAGILDGTPLEFDYLTLAGGTRQDVAQSIQTSLAECGIGARLQLLAGEQLFAPGPDGPVFGRSFGMAQFAWASSFDPPCYLYTSREIPGPYPDYPKGWGGANASGYSNPDFDLACQAAQQTLGGTYEYQQAQRQAQLLFSQDMPALPLFSHFSVLASRPDFCGLENSTYTENFLWNIEQFDYGTGCQ